MQGGGRIPQGCDPPCRRRRLYQFRDRTTGRPLARLRNGTYVTRSGRTIGITHFQACHDRRALRAAGHRWPLDWQLRVPELKRSENLRAVLRDQLVRNRIVPTFWEGVRTAFGLEELPPVAALSSRTCVAASSEAVAEPGSSDRRWSSAFLIVLLLSQAPVAGWDGGRRVHQQRRERCRRRCLRRPSADYSKTFARSEP
jgi:hypothetical protein